MNSTVMPGSFSSNVARNSSMTSSELRAALRPGLQPDDDVAGVLRGGEQAEFRAGAAREPQHLRRVAQHLLDAAHHPSVSGSDVPVGVQ